MKFNVTFPDGNSVTLIRDCKENVIKYLKLSDIFSDDVVIEPVDFYHELRGISLTHLQCAEVIELLHTYKINLSK